MTQLFYQRWQSIISILFLIVCWLPIAQAATDCTQVTQISQMECEILLDIYHSMDGPNWKRGPTWGWNETNSPCGKTDFWSGVTCSNGHVIRLQFSSSDQLNGTIPTSIGNLSQLREIHIRGLGVRGTIPESIGNLSQLQILDISYTQLTGKIPESIGDLVQLTWIILINNQLTGQIPKSISNLDKLEKLDLYHNQLTGQIPESIGNLSNLMSLQLYHNQLTGQIPKSIGSLDKLNAINLENNHINGQIPESIGNLNLLASLWLNNNQLCGLIPASLINTKLGNSIFRYNLRIDNNHLTAYEPSFINWLNKSAGPNWSSTQTASSLPCIESEKDEPCVVYALHDDGLNDSQFFTINPEADFTVEALGESHIGYDIEGLTIHPKTQTLYASAGDDPKAGLESGYIYQVNKENGALTPVCGTGLGEVSAISFHPNNQTLWIWAERKGLFTVALDHIQDGVCQTTEIVKARAKVEGMAWNNEGSILYGASGTTLYQYENGTVAQVCQNFPSEVEALDMLADGTLLFALHEANDTRIHSFDIETCTIKDTVPLPVETPYTDIEGITWHCPTP
jgi:hypothetical protein